MSRKYTDEQKSAVLARVPEIGVHAAAEEAGIPWKKVAKWNKAAAFAQADEKISAAQDLLDNYDEEAAEANLAEAVAVIDKTAEENAQAASEAVQEKKEAKKAAREEKKEAKKAAREEKKLKKAAKEDAKKSSKKACAAKMNLIFESNNGMQITLQEIAGKIPKGCDAAYVKTEENKIYWVKGEETGSADIW